MSPRHDLIVLGGGAAGTAAALAGARAGLDVVLVEPGRARRSREAERALAELLAQRPLSGAPDERRPSGWAAAVRMAGEAAAAAADGRDRSLATAGVARVGGRARLGPAEGQVSVGSSLLSARHVLVATGSEAALPEGWELEPSELLDRAALLDLRAAPSSAVVVGDGLEAAGLAGLLAAAGTRVSVLARGGALLPDADPDVASAVARALGAEGVEITRAAPPSRGAEGLRFERDGGAGPLEAANVLVAEGRRASRATCGLEELVPDLPDVLPEDRYAAGPPGLWLAGSVTGRRLVPEEAAREGRAVVAAIAGASPHVPRRAVPRVVVGLAGCGWSGWTEPAARAAGHALVIGRAQLPGSGRLRPGFVKVIGDASSNRLLGVHAAGARCREAVLLGATAVEWGVSRLDLAELAFPDETAAAALVEAVRRAEPA